MKCPICGQELVQSKKDPNYLLCYNCKKKFRVSGNSTSSGQTQSEQPRQAAQTVQAMPVGQSAQESRARYEDSYDDQYDDDYEEEEHLSNAPIIVLAVAIVIVLALIIYMLLL